MNARRHFGIVIVVSADVDCVKVRVGHIEAELGVARVDSDRGFDRCSVQR